MRKSISLWIIVLFALASCQKEKFVRESEWLSPLFKASLGINDLIADSNLQVNSDNSYNLVVQYEEKLDSLLEILEVPDSLTEVSVSLTQLILEDRTFTDTLTLVEMYPPAILLNGKTTTLDAQDISSDQGTIIDVTEQFFKTATFNEGFLDMKIYNDLPVEVELIEFELLNNDDQTVVISDAWNNLMPFSSASKSYDLAGKTVDGVLEALLKRIKTKQSNGEVLIEANKGLRIELAIRDLKPQSATAIFPAQNLIEKEEETTYNFGGPQITTMRLKGGEVLMEVYSTIEEEIILEYEVPQSAHVTTGEKITKTFKIPPSVNGVPSRTDERFPIANYEIIYKGKDVNSPPFVNTFYSVLNARIEYTGIERSLSLSDSIYIKFGLVDVVPELAIGDFGKKTYTFNEAIDVPAFRNLYGNISLEDASLDLVFENSFGIEANVDIYDLQGLNNRTGKSVKLVSPEIDNTIFLRRGVNILTSIRPYTKTISFDKSNSNFKLFFENIPDLIEPNFSVTTRPNGSNNFQDFAFYDSYLKTRLELNVPLEIGMDSLTLVKKQAFNWGEEDLKEVKEANLKLQVDNGFPWSAIVKLEFLDDDDQVLKTYFNTLDHLIKEGLIDIDTDKVIAAQRSNLEFTLSAMDIMILKSASKIRITSSFNTPNAKRYKIYDNYTIDFKLIADFKYEN